MLFRNAQRQIDMAALTMAGQAANSSAEALGRLERHEEDCLKYREAMRRELADHRTDVNKRLDKQDADRDRMHGENQTKFDRLFRALYIATGIIMAASAVLSRGGLGEMLKQLVK